MIEDEEAKSFFEFLISNRPSDKYTSDLDGYVNDAKHNMQWRFQYMTIERMQSYAFDAGARKKAIETAKNLLKENIPEETTARCIGLPLEEVQKLAAEIKA